MMTFYAVIMMILFTVSFGLKNFNTRYQIDRMRLDSIRSLIATGDISKLQTALRRQLPNSTSREVFKNTTLNSRTREFLRHLNDDGYISHENTYENRLKLAIILATLSIDKTDLGSVSSWAS